ncbi:MAG: ATP-binding protein [Gemmataceae bacterium]
MAWQCRIRHKLMIGLALVVGLMALVLVGTLHGLNSYRTTVNVMDSKLVELHAAQNLKTVLNNLNSAPSTSTPLSEEKWLRLQIGLAEEALRNYEDKLQLTIQRHRDIDDGYKERIRIEALEEKIQVLEQKLSIWTQTQFMVQQPSADLRSRGPIKEAIDDLIRTADELHEVIYEDLYRRISIAKEDYNRTLAIVLTTSIGGVLLLVGLLRFFYRWTFSPIHDLQQGVARVAEGDFDHRIQVCSRDEMHELADAFNDMTSRLQEMYTDLARQVNERSRQLVRSERLAGVGFLAAGVAHEINNPLASIAFCSEALERRVADLRGHLAGTSPKTNYSSYPAAEDTERSILAFPTPRSPTQVAAQAEEWEVIAKYLKMIQQEAFRCKSITQRLLEFSRGGERHREPTDLADLIQGVLDMVQHHETSKGKHLVFQPTHQFIAWVNAQDIKSVVLNLVVNALESMDEGGTLTITLRERDRQAEMVFTDSGCGMTTEVLENIFEPFYTRSRTGKGTGLGLSISHRIINQHGGEIEATSAGPNQGSTFLVRLPLRPVEAVKEDSLGNAAA